MDSSTQNAPCSLWKQWASTKPARPTSSASLMDDADDEEAFSRVLLHMQLAPVSTVDDHYLPKFPVTPKRELEPAQSGALPMVPLQRCNRS